MVFTIDYYCSIVPPPGALAIIAWMLFAGMAAIISRYYKGAMAGEFCGLKLWFQVGRDQILCSSTYAKTNFPIAIFCSFRYVKTDCPISCI